jgi:hypothetical protein
MINIILGWVGGSLSYAAVYMSLYRIQYRRLYRKYLEWKQADPGGLVRVLYKYDMYIDPIEKYRRQVRFDEWMNSFLQRGWLSFHPGYLIIWPLVGVYVLGGSMGEALWKRVLYPFMHPRVDTVKPKKIKPRKPGPDYDKIQKLEKELFKD